MTGFAQSPDYDNSQDYVVTYASGTERVLWGEAAAASEQANYPGSTYETLANYTKRMTKAAKSAKSTPADE
jgi:hypothetical protein